MYRAFEVVPIVSGARELLTTDGTKPPNRLVDTAHRICYFEGIPHVGIDRLTRDAGVSKTTWYTHFGSQAGLVEQCPLARHRQVMSEVRQQAELHASDPFAAILGVFGLAKRLTETPGYRGCPFTLALHEVGLGFALMHKFAMRDRKLVTPTKWPSSCVCSTRAPWSARCRDPERAPSHARSA